MHPCNLFAAKDREANTYGWPVHVGKRQGGFTVVMQDHPKLDFTGSAFDPNLDQVVQNLMSQLFGVRYMRMSPDVRSALLTRFLLALPEV